MEEENKVKIDITRFEELIEDELVLNQIKKFLTINASISYDGELQINNTYKLTEAIKILCPTWCKNTLAQLQAEKDKEREIINE